MDVLSLNMEHNLSDVTFFSLTQSRVYFMDIAFEYYLNISCSLIKLLSGHQHKRHTMSWCIVYEDRHSSKSRCVASAVRGDCFILPLVKMAVLIVLFILASNCTPSTHWHDFF